MIKKGSEKMSIFVVSKMSNSIKYTTWKTVKSGSNNITNNVVHNVLINGGVGVLNSRTLIAPDGRGVFTEITAEDKEFLINNPVFKRHLEKGFVRIVESEKSNVGEKLQVEDNSAQLTDEDFSNEENIANDYEAELKISDKKVKTKRKISSKRK
jgi:hypothetical protein